MIFSKGMKIKKIAMNMLLSNINKYFILMGLEYIYI